MLRFTHKFPDADLNCVVLAAVYAVVPSRTNLSLAAVLCRYNAGFKIKLVNSQKYCSNFFFLGDRIILIFHLTQNDSLTFPRRCCFWEALRSISHNEQLATIMLQQSHYYVLRRT